MEYNNGLKQCGAYEILHVKTNFVYVGSSGDLYSREVNHRSLLGRGVHHNPALQNAFNEDNSIVFKYYVTPDRDKAYELEQQLINQYQATGRCFNYGADAKAPYRGLSHSSDTVEKIRQANIGRTHTTEAREKMRVNGEGKGAGVQKSQQHRENISKALVGRDIAETTKEKLREKALARARPVSIDGVVYPSVLIACERLALAQGTLRFRLSSDTFSNYYFVEKASIC